MPNTFQSLVREHVQATRAGRLGQFDYSVIGSPPYTDEILFGAVGGLRGNGWIAPESAAPARRNDQRFMMEIRGDDGSEDGVDLGDTYTGPLPSVSDFVSNDSTGNEPAKWAFEFFRKVAPSSGNPDPANKATRHYGYVQTSPTLVTEGGSGPLPAVVENKSFTFSVAGPILSTHNNVDVAELEMEVQISIHGSVAEPLPGPARRPTVAMTVTNKSGNPSPSDEWGMSEFYFNFANSSFFLSNMRLREEPSHYTLNRKLN